MGGSRQLGFVLAVLGGCQTGGLDVSGVAGLPPLDYAVLVTGGAFLRPGPEGAMATFAPGFPPDAEPLRLQDFLTVLRAGTVFHRIEQDADETRRRAVLQLLQTDTADVDLLPFLQAARDDGFDLLLVVEQVQDGEIEDQGINSRWPVTLATWLMLGVGMFIPDHTFESRATLRVTLRDLQTGRVVHDPLLVAGPVELSMVERTNFLGFVISILVPPFWVHGDKDRVQRGVQAVTMQRLLSSLVRDLKSEPVRARLRERAVASITLDGRRLSIDAAESVTAVRLRPQGGALPAAAAQQFERVLLDSLRRQGERYRYDGELPAGLERGPMQVLVGTITGNVASSTFVVGARR